MIILSHVGFLGFLLRVVRKDSSTDTIPVRIYGSRLRVRNVDQ